MFGKKAKTEEKAKGKAKEAQLKVIVTSRSSEYNIKSCFSFR